MNRLKTLLLIFIAVLIFFSTILLIQSKKTDLNYYTQTKAICNKTNYCQDYYVSCNERKIISATPITGATIQQQKSWKDPRNEKEREFCS